MKNGMIVDVWGDKWWYKDGKLHREDGPAIERANGDKSWCLSGVRHRVDGPAEESSGGHKIWYINGKCHREHGPAVEHADGTKEWYIDGLLHREDGPAIERANGSKEWYLNGKRHREDGHAVQGCDGTIWWHVNGRLRHSVECDDGPKWWYINGVQVTEQIVMQPESITLAQIQENRNNEVRSVMIERYGWHRFLADSNAKMIDKRDNLVENTKEALFAAGELGNRLVVTCPTGRIFTLGVPNDTKTCEAAQQWLGNSTDEINVIGRT